MVLAEAEVGQLVPVVVVLGLGQVGVVQVVLVAGQVRLALANRLVGVHRVVKLVFFLLSTS